MAPLGERIGATLEASERDYFGLFPTLRAPLPWDFVAQTDSVFVRSEGRTLRGIPREDVERLRRLIDTFEDHASILQNPNWVANRAFVEYIDAKTPIPTGAASRIVRVQTAEGSYSGFTLYTTDSTLVMAPEVFPRDASLAGAYTLPRASVLALDRERSYAWQTWGPVLGIGVGAAIGAALPLSIDRRAAGAFGALAGITMGSITSELASGGLVEVDPAAIDGLALYNGPRPPELPTASGAIARATGPRPAPVPKRERPRSFEWVSAGVHGAVATTDAPQAPITTFIARSLTRNNGFRTLLMEQTREPLDVPYRLDASIRPIKWLRVGAFVGSFTTGGDVSPLLEEEQVTRTVGSVRPYAEGILPLIRWGNRRVEISGGGGRQSYNVRVTQRAPDTVEVGTEIGQASPFPLLRAEQTAFEEGSAWFYNAGVEVYTSRFSSLFVRHTWYPLPTLEQETFENIYRPVRPNRPILRIVDAHSVDFSYREVTVGSRFHF